MDRSDHEQNCRELRQHVDGGERDSAVKVEVIIQSNAEEKAMCAIFMLKIVCFLVRVLKVSTQGA